MSADGFVTKDSGARTTFSTGGQRDVAAGKGRFDLIPTLPLRRLAELYERGAVKYEDRNWEKGMPLMRYIDSLMRHTNNLVAGEPDEDHAAAIAFNVFGFMFTLDQIERGLLPKELDDRPAPEGQYRQPAPLEIRSLPTWPEWIAGGGNCPPLCNRLSQGAACWNIGCEHHQADA